MQLSIVVPAHNEAENIAELIRCVESSVPIPHELIVVNDHSVDQTSVIVEECARSYPCVRLAHNAFLPGFANALLTGFGLAQGDCVVPVMADSCD